MRNAVLWNLAHYNPAYKYQRFGVIYRGADKSLARPDWKNNWKVAIFSSDAEVIAAAVTWLDGQLPEFFLSGVQNLEFGRCSLFPSWLGKELISTPVLVTFLREKTL